MNKFETITWTSVDGTVPVREMTTDHIVNALRMMQSYDDKMVDYKGCARWRWIQIFNTELKDRGVFPHAEELRQKIDHTQKSMRLLIERIDNLKTHYSLQVDNLVAMQKEYDELLERYGISVASDTKVAGLCPNDDGQYEDLDSKTYV